ncbi:MAG: pitrilysin family protein, partial [Deltaproteobacteria bacterium]|nr:pitrilysin family protein [Deltaproteobacteria bacterium]
ELPLIQLSVLIRTGSMYDPPQKSGLAGVAAQVWRNGGTQKQTSQAIRPGRLHPNSRPQLFCLPHMILCRYPDDMKFFYPNNFLLGISGDFQTEEMMASLEQAFGGWERSIIELPYIPLPKSRSPQSIYHAEKDLTQSTILYGHLSIPLDHPDHIPFKVLNFLLGGGGFNSRLTREIRSNQGLAYSVGSFYQGRVGYGVFGAFCQTKSTSTGRVISLLEGIIGGIKTNKPGPEELEWAKNSLINQFIFSFTSSGNIVTQQMHLEYDGLPADTLQRYPGRVQAVSLEDLNRVAENHLHPDQSILLVVGKEKDFDQSLSSFGLVNRLELNKYD